MAVRHLAVVGAGWAGLAAAVRARQAGHRVTVLEMAPRPGGRARSMEGAPQGLDNGQHILIGAYSRTLSLMQDIGVDPGTLLRRLPLTLRHADGRGLSLPAGPTPLALLRGVAAAAGWGWKDRLSLATHVTRWMLAGFDCDPQWTVARLCRHLTAPVRELLIDPLCVAALNTPSHDASARVFLRVLRDALFSGPGSADLLLPTRPLDELLPAPATRWLRQHGVELRTTTRAGRLARQGQGWTVDDEPFDGVLLCTPAREAARLAAPIAPDWARLAEGLSHEPIVTVYLRSQGEPLTSPILALTAGADHPAQFVFDRRALGLPDGLLACVISGAQPWVDAGLPATADAVCRQLMRELPSLARHGPLEVVRTVAEKRATFRCTPGLRRPPARIGPGLVAAGDHVQGPYPATLEGAVRAAEQGLALCLADLAALADPAAPAS